MAQPPCWEPRGTPGRRGRGRESGTRRSRIDATSAPSGRRVDAGSARHGSSARCRRWPGPRWWAPGPRGPASGGQRPADRGLRRGRGADRGWRGARCGRRGRRGPWRCPGRPAAAGHGSTRPAATRTRCVPGGGILRRADPPARRRIGLLVVSQSTKPARRMHSGPWSGRRRYITQVLSPVSRRSLLVGRVRAAWRHEFVTSQSTTPAEVSGSGPPAVESGPRGARIDYLTVDDACRGLGSGPPAVGPGRGAHDSLLHSRRRQPKPQIQRRGGRVAAGAPPAQIRPGAPAASRRFGKRRARFRARRLVRSIVVARGGP